MPNLHVHPTYTTPPTHREPRPHTFSLRALGTIAIAGALIGAWLSPGRAHADQVEPPDRTVNTLRVAYTEPMPRNAMYVELNDGSTWHLRPCRYEDSRHCYWDADTRGNMRGRSFVALRGTIIHTHKI